MIANVRVHLQIEISAKEIEESRLRRFDDVQSWPSMYLNLGDGIQLRFERAADWDLFKDKIASMPRYQDKSK